MNEKELKYWNSYLKTLRDKPINPTIITGVVGNHDITDELLSLYISGKKTASSSLLKDYKVEEYRTEIIKYNQL